MQVLPLVTLDTLLRRHHLYSCSSRTWMSIYTHTHTRAVTRGWPVDQWTSSPALLHDRFHPPLPSLPAACCCSAPSGSRKRHKGFLCCEPSASLPQALSSDWQWDTQPDLSTCTDVDELKHCLNTPHPPSILNSLLHAFIINTSKLLSLSIFSSCFSLSSQTVAIHIFSRTYCTELTWICRL